MGRASRLDEEKGLVASVKDSLLYPVRIALSPPFLRTYLRTVLVVFAALSLLGVAACAYLSFYYAYIPARGFTIPVHLQFPSPYDSRVAAGVRPAFPYGVAPLNRQVASRQRYNVKVVLNMPRTPGNLQAGNFMLDLKLRGPGQEPVTPIPPPPPSSAIPTDELAEAEAAMGLADILARDRRPAIMTYRSTGVELAYKFARLPLYMAGWGQEAEDVVVPMLDGIIFEKGWRNLPTSLWLEIRSREVLQVYRANVVFTAKLEGLRYVMYNYRITSFLFFTAAFWFVSLTFALGTWGIFSVLLPSRSQEPKRETTSDTGGEPRIKQEVEADGTDTPASLSDTSRIFPTLSTQPPLHYSAPMVKEEEEDEEDDDAKALHELPLAATEADDEDDEDADFVLDDSLRLGAMGDRASDSGLGTSLDSGVERRTMRKRRSGGLGPGGGG